MNDQLNYWRKMAASLKNENSELRTESAELFRTINSYRLLAVIGWAGFVGALCLTL